MCQQLCKRLGIEHPLVESEPVAFVEQDLPPGPRIHGHREISYKFITIDGSANLLFCEHSEIREGNVKTAGFSHIFTRFSRETRCSLGMLKPMRAVEAVERSRRGEPTVSPVLNLCSAENEDEWLEPAEDVPR